MTELNWSIHVDITPECPSIRPWFSFSRTYVKGTIQHFALHKSGVSKFSNWGPKYLFQII